MQFKFNIYGLCPVAQFRTCRRFKNIENLYKRIMLNSSISVHSLFSRLRDFLLATVAFEDDFVQHLVGTRLPLSVESAVPVLASDESVFEVLAISGKINSVFDGFRELGNFDVDLHFVPLG